MVRLLTNQEASSVKMVTPITELLLTAKNVFFLETYFGIHVWTQFLRIVVVQRHHSSDCLVHWLLHALIVVLLDCGVAMITVQFHYHVVGHKTSSTWIRVS